MRYAVLALLALILACGGAARPTPAASPTPAPTPTPAPPTPTLEPAARYEELARAAARPLDTRGALGLPAGEWSVETMLPGEVTVMYPMTAGNDNAQTVRQGQRQIAAMVKALFDGAPELDTVNVVGTLPLGGAEAPAISVLLTREEYAGWDGTSGMQVSPRLQ